MAASTSSWLGTTFRAHGHNHGPSKVPHCAGKERGNCGHQNIDCNVSLSCGGVVQNIAPEAIQRSSPCSRSRMQTNLSTWEIHLGNASQSSGRRSTFDWQKIATTATIVGRTSPVIRTHTSVTHMSLDPSGRDVILPVFVQEFIMKRNHQLVRYILMSESG